MYLLLALFGLTELMCGSAAPEFVQRAAQRKLSCKDVLVRRQGDFYLGWCEGDGKFEYGGDFPSNPVWLHCDAGACQPANEYCASKSSVQRSEAPASLARGRWSCTNSLNDHFVWALEISGNEITGQSLAPGNNAILRGSVLPSGLLEVNGARVKVGAGARTLNGVGFAVQCYDFTCTR